MLWGKPDCRGAFTERSCHGACLEILSDVVDIVWMDTIQTKCCEIKMILVYSKGCGSSFLCTCHTWNRQVNKDKSSFVVSMGQWLVGVGPLASRASSTHRSRTQIALLVLSSPRAGSRLGNKQTPVTCHHLKGRQLSTEPLDPEPQRTVTSWQCCLCIPVRDLSLRMLSSSFRLISKDPHPHVFPGPRVMGFIWYVTVITLTRPFDQTGGEHSK